MPETAKTVTFVGTLMQIKRYGEDFTIGYLEGGAKVVGNTKDGELTLGLKYNWFGHFEDNRQFGQQFKFSHFTVAQPHTKGGVVNYLRRFAPNIGSAYAGRLWDRFESDAVKVLRTDPKRAAAAIGLSPAKAEEAAKELRELDDMEDTKIDLIGLFDGLGFPHALVDLCCKAWGVRAPDFIRRDPFILLVKGFHGVGFQTCDNFYIQQGRDPTKLKRQMLCMWDALRSEGSSTWVKAQTCEDHLKTKLSGVELNSERALELGIRSNWLAERWDCPQCKGVKREECSKCQGTGGERWLTEKARFEAEQTVARKLVELSDWSKTQEAA